jgi:hypothetical protein
MEVKYEFSETFAHFLEQYFRVSRGFFNVESGYPNVRNYHFHGSSQQDSCISLGDDSAFYSKPRGSMSTNRWPTRMGTGYLTSGMALQK